jgi:hypothetical protein
MGESPDERVIRSYLLGEMSAEERAAFQQRIFEDDEVFQRVLAAEDDLTDSLARGELPPAEAARVRLFLDESSQRSRVPIARALARLEKRQSAGPIWRRALPLAACLVLALAALWLALRNRELNTRLAEAPPAPQVATDTFAVAIPAGTVRGSSSRPAIAIPQGARIVELRLEVRAPGAHAGYRVEIARDSAPAILSLMIPAPLPAELSIPISRIALSPGNYEIALSGVDANQPAAPIDYYYCTVR